MQKQRILIVDDEPDILDMLEYNLQNEGYDVERAIDGDEALRIAKVFKPDLMLLDVMMPKLDGVEACRRLREQPDLKKTYIIFLTARGEEFAELAGFEAGADDYITKPIKPRALLSRLRAILRRSVEVTNEESKTLNVGGLQIIKDEYIVYLNGQAINLPKKEFELLFFLAEKPGKVFSRETLLEKIWGSDVFVVPRTIDVHVRKLREKLGEQYIQTIKGVGYKFTG
jgi:two-component system alkaline phosphatase synthesis response regulator PhoP